ncbi:hypothetical protein [Actinoplanes sp. NBRC 103695]|nr:hypothetical protein [Actinoplanes sp. NBRC 103695]GLY95935.1 hypothetical protein Acsp02_31900 [Actinoplanes sp. NBRC 103695]
MSAEPLATTPQPAESSERGLLIAMAILVLTGVVAMLLMTS